MRLLGIFVLLGTTLVLAKGTEHTTDHDAVTPAHKNSALEQVALTLIEGFRETMRTGSDSLPVLDPFHVDNFTLNGQSFGVPGLLLSMADMLVDHLSTFEIHEFGLRISSVLTQRYTITIDISVPVIDVDTKNYNMNVAALGYEIYGSGEARLRFLRPRLTGSMVLRLPILPGFSFSFESCDLKLALEGFDADIKGLFHDDDASGFLSLVLKHLLPELVDLYEISAAINKFLPDLVNGAVTRTRSHVAVYTDVETSMDNMDVDYWQTE